MSCASYWLLLDLNRRSDYLRISIIAMKSSLHTSHAQCVRFVTERLCFAKRCSSSCERLLWAWITHLLSLQSISFCLPVCLASIVNAFFRKTVSQLFLCIFSAILSRHLAVYRPKHGFSLLWWDLCMRILSKQRSVPLESESRLRTPFSLVPQCYQTPGGFMLRLTWFSR